MSEVHTNIEKHKSEAERIGNDVADAYNKGLTENLIKAEKEVVEAFNKRYQAIKYQYEFGVITDEEYYKKLEQARDRYFSRNTQEWHKYTKEIYDYRKEEIAKYQELVEESMEDLLKTVEKSIQDGEKLLKSIDSSKEGYKEKLLDFSGSSTGFDTHKTIVENYWPTGDPLVMVDYTLADYDKEIKKLTDFNDSITKLKERAKDIDPEVFSMFFDEIRGMSVDDAKILTDLLLDADGEDFKKHFELYGKKNALAENMATSFYADDYKEAASTIKKELEEIFAEVPPEFFAHGQNLAESFAEGFISEIDSLLADLTVEIPVIASGSEGNNVENNTFSPVYYLYGDRAATSRTRIIAKNDDLFNYMRGMTNR
jgi:hypothetical protein